MTESVVLPREAIERLLAAGVSDRADAQQILVKACATNKLYARGLMLRRNMTQQFESLPDSHDTPIPSYHWADLEICEGGGSAHDFPSGQDVWFLWDEGQFAAQRSTPEGEVQDLWRSVVFDGARLEALALRLAEKPTSGKPVKSLPREVVLDWVRNWPGTNVDRAWEAFRREAAHRGYNREAFRADWREITGRIGRGARTSRALRHDELSAKLEVR
jgi:hypothetical protein